MATFDTWTGTHSGALRNALRMSQRDFAKRLGAGLRSVNRWEADGPISHVFQGALDTLASSLTPEARRVFQYLLDGEDPEEQVTQQLISSMPVGGLATLGLSRDVAARAEWLLSGAGRPDMRVVERIRTTLHDQMLNDDLLGAPAAQGTVISQQELAEALLLSCPEALKPHLLSVYAEATGFAGCLAWDMDDVATARRLYNLARDAAHEAEDNDLSAYVLCHLSQLALWEGKPRIGVDDAVAAVAWAKDSRDILLRSYTNVRAAHAYAKAGQRKGCLDALEVAEADLRNVHGNTPADSRAYFHGPGLFYSYKGECLGLLGDHKEAAVASRKALTLIDADKIRDTALSMLDLHRALLRLNEVDEAAKWLGDAAVLTETNRSRRLISALSDARKGLAPWSRDPAVRRLDERLASRDIVLA